MWTRFALDLILAKAKRLVELDQATELLTKGRLARVTVEINLAMPLTSCTNVAVENSDLRLFWQMVECEDIHLLSEMQ